MKVLRNTLVAIAVVFAGISAFAADETRGMSAAPEPVIVHMAKFPITVGGGEYELLTVIQDFPAGSGFGNHKHGGNVLVTVLSGEMTLREKGHERVVKTGESWTESPGDVHAVVNARKETARVAISILLPKGAEVTTMVK